MKADFTLPWMSSNKHCQQDMLEYKSNEFKINFLALEMMKWFMKLTQIDLNVKSNDIKLPLKKQTITTTVIEYLYIFWKHQLQPLSEIGYTFQHNLNLIALLMMLNFSQVFAGLTF